MMRRLALLIWAPLLAQSAHYDVILRNGTIVDGTGGKSYRADVGIRNGYIFRIGDLHGDRGDLDIDVAGLAVAPGFINLHDHATPAGLRTAVNMLTQGVTSEIMNADGSGALDLDQQLGALSAGGLAVNVGAYIGFNSIWSSVAGAADRRPTAAEIQTMRELLTVNLRRGAWGVSAGLDYKPAYFAKTEDVIAVLNAAAPWRTNFPNHDRLTPESKYSSIAAIGETIEIGEKANVMPVVTHMKVQGREQGSAGKALAMMRAAGERGHETVADIYPYLAGQTGLGALFVPAWAVAGGQEEMRKRFQDRALRERIAREIEEAIEARVLTPGNIDLPSKGRKFVDYMREWNAGSGETMIRILEKEHPSAIMKFGSENDLVELLRYPGSAVSCDCGASEERPGMHPRYFGTFPRVLGHYVRETQALTLEDAVRKMTGLPASISGMVDRGFLAVGMAADITVFDPRTIIDRATYERPTLPSEGVRHVFVNGKAALRDGKATGEVAGRVLKRSPNMPSRPMRLNAVRSVEAKTRLNSLDISQSPDGKTRGHFRFTNLNSLQKYQMAEIGLIQTFGNWATFTARATIDLGTERTVRVIVDGSNPLSPTPTLMVEDDTGRSFTDALKGGDFKIGSK